MVGDIGWALARMKEGKRVTRPSWNGKQMYLFLKQPSTFNFENSDATLPFVMLSTTTGDLVPWLCSQTDLLATDWVASEAP